MSYSLVAHTQIAPGSGGGTTAAIDTTGADLIVFVVNSYPGISGSPISVSDNKGNTWNALTNQTVGNVDARIFCAKNATVGSGHTFTFSLASSYPVITILAYSGSNTSAPFDVENGSTTSGSSSLQTGSVTPSQASSLIVCACTYEFGTAGAETWDAPFSSNQFHIDWTSGNNEGGNVGYEIQSGGPTARNPTSSGGGTLTRAAAIAVFKPAVAGAILKSAGLDGRISNGVGLNGGMAG